MNRKASIILFVIAITLLLIAHFAEAQKEEDQMSEPVVVDLTGTSWWVEDLLEKGVVDRSHTTIEFFQEGRVAGDTGCNRYSGPFERDGESVRFGMLAGTRRACLAALMDQETRFYEALERAVVLRVDIETGLLHLFDVDNVEVLRASNIVPVTEE